MSGYNEVFAHFVSDETNEYKLKVKRVKEERWRWNHNQQRWIH